MKKFLLVLFLLSFCGLCSNVFAELDHSAYVTYEAFLSEKPTGIYLKDGFVFFIVDIEISGKRVPQRVYEAQAMNKVRDLLKKFFTKGIVIEKSGIKNYKGAIRDKIEDLISTDDLCDFNINNLRGQVLINDPERKDGKRYYRYVFSVADDEVNKKKKELSSVDININYLVHKIFKEALLNDQYQELVSYYFEIGLWENAISFQKKILSQKFNLVNYYHSVAPIEERKILRMLLRNMNSMAEPELILKKLPGNIEALDTIINDFDKRNPLKKVVLQFTKFPAVPENDLDATYNKLNKLLKDVDSRIGLTEYLQVLEGIQKRRASHSFIDNNIIRNSFNALGHLSMDKSLKKSTNSFFQSAVKYFNKGGDKNKIRQLLVQSINESPRHSESWNYLGAIMTAENLPYESVVLHTQAYLLDNENLETMANLADCYLRLGKKNLALDYATYLDILNDGEKNKFINKVVNKIRKEK